MNWAEQNRTSSYLDKTTAPLLEKLRKVKAQDPANALFTEESITDKDWKVLAHLAATGDIAAMFSRSPGKVTGIPLTEGDEGLKVARYYDPTYSYLVEALLDDGLLDAVAFMAGPDRSTFGDRNRVSVVANKIMSNLLSERKMGPWTDRVPHQSLMAHERLLKGAAVKGDVARDGDDPKWWENQLGSNWANIEQLPEPEHMSTLDISGSAADSMQDWLGGDPLAYVSLQNHFASDITLTITRQPSGMTVDPAVEQAFFASVTGMAPVEMDQSYRVMDLTKIQRRIQEINQDAYDAWVAASRDPQLFQPLEFSLSISYVDMFKKPAGMKWANNVYFEGVGRESAYTVGAGAVASLIFGIQGLSKLGQQRPLDFAARNGSQFFQIKTSPLSVVQDMERAGSSVQEILARKALHLWSKKYEDDGQLLPADLPALYKMMTMRHIVQGVKDGKLVRMWSDQAIALGNLDTYFDNGDWKLMPISRTVATVLWGGAGYKGTAAGLQRPVFNIEDMPALPSLDEDRLRKLDLNQIGDPVDVANSQLAQVRSLPKAVPHKGRGAQHKTIWQTNVRRWIEDHDKRHTRRMAMPRVSKERMDTRIASLSQIVASEVMYPILSRIGVPTGHLYPSGLQVSANLARNVRNLQLSSTTLLWRHEQDSVGDLDTGVVGGAQLDNGFAAWEDTGSVPTYGDIVEISLEHMLLAAGGDPETAYSLARSTIEWYADRGVTIALDAPPGTNGLRADLARWLNSGSLGYFAMAGSTHFWAPATNSQDYYSANKQALESALTETTTHTADGLAVVLASNTVDTATSEGVVLMSKRDTYFNRTHGVILPTSLTITSDGNNDPRHSFGLPSPEQWAQIATRLQDVIRTPEGEKDFIAMLGGDPKDVSFYRKNTDPMKTVENGVLPQKEAVKALFQQIRNGTFPVEIGATLYTGTFIPVVSEDGTLLFTRLGFVLPDAVKMESQFAQAQERFGVRMAFATSKIDAQHTLPPPFKVQERSFSQEQGLWVKGESRLNMAAKFEWVGPGLKLSYGPMSDRMQFIDEPLGLVNDTYLTQLTSEHGVYSKLAQRDMVDNFANLFRLTGIDFRQLLVERITGKVPADDVEFEKQWGLVLELLNAWADLPHGYTATQVATLLDHDQLINQAGDRLNQLAHLFSENNWRMVSFRRDASQPQDPKDRIFTVLMMSLMAAPLRPEHVVSTRGLLTVTNKDRSEIRRLPSLLTDALFDTRHPGMVKLLVDMANSQLNTIEDPDNPGRQIYPVWFDEALRAHVRMVDPKTGKHYEQEGRLILAMPRPSNSNAEALGQSSRRGETVESPHTARTIAAALGGWVATRAKATEYRGKDDQGQEIQGALLPDVFDELEGDNQLARFDTEPGQAFWNMLTRINRKQPAYNPWEVMRPLQGMHQEKGRQKVRQYTFPIDKEPWDRKPEVTAAATKLLKSMGVQSDVSRRLVEVDYLVRQFTGRPGPTKDQTDWFEAIDQDVYLQVLTLMQKNVDRHMHPLNGGMVAMPHRDFWEMVWRENQKLPAGARWKLLFDGNPKSQRYATTWDEFVNALLGQVLLSNNDMNAAFRTALDGFWHTYAGTSTLRGQVDWSLDEGTKLKLIDPRTNQPYMSLDPGVQALLEDPVIWEHMENSWEAMVGKPTHPDELLTASYTESSPLAEQLAQQEEWASKQGLGKQNKVSYRQYGRMGASYTESARRTSPILAGMVNLSIMMRLANPALWASSMIEVPMRMTLERATDMLTGSSISAAGKLAAAAAETKAGQALGWEPAYTVQEQRILHQLAIDLGRNPEFIGTIYREMMYRTSVDAGPLEKQAAFVARVVSDPKLGMQARSAAKMYLNGALEHMMITGTQISVTQLAQLMEQDPLYIKKNSDTSGYSAHKAGMQRLGQGRGTNSTMLAMPLTKTIDRLTGSPSIALNGLGTALKIPFAFTRYNSSMLLTLTGLGQFDQMAALFLGGRRKGGILDKFTRSAGLQPGDDTFEYWDTDDVIESLDLSRAFVRGAVTHTGLMMAGMALGSLGLTGEDDEERRRRKLAEYLNVPHYYDPRQAANDFTWRNAIFLDQIPFLGTWYKNSTGHSAVVPHWILQQFLAPVLGMSRFFENGDIREIGWGFQQAISVIPYSFLRTFDEADLTAKMLADAAKDATAEQTEAAQDKAASLILNIVMVYEKALLENSFVNSLYSAMDPYDRDPWVVPMTAEENTGELDRTQGQDLPQQTNALMAYQDVDPVTGEPINKAAYLTREGKDAYWHQYTENNLTAAIFGSLFTGGLDSTYFRRNMAVKQREVQLGETTQAEAEALIVSTFLARGGQEKLTKEEIIQQLKQRDSAAGKWWDQEAIEAEASAIYASQSPEWKMSIADGEVGELISLEGGKAVYRGILKGSYDIGSAALAGITMDQEMRDKIAEEMFDEIVLEGVNLGLGDQAAMYRARRFWYGEGTNPGLREIIYDKRIPSKSVATYNQLNVTYAIGPDGKPWATPFQKTDVLQAAGIPLPYQMTSPGPGQRLDARGNVVDEVLGINTGISSVVRIPELADVEPNDKAVEKAESKTYTSGGGGFGGYGGYSGGGYSSGYGSPYFQRMLPLPGGTSPRLNSLPMINTSNPIIRRANIRRERITSERGRLKQWQ
jgi:hypothetical protein